MVTGGRIHRSNWLKGIREAGYARLASDRESAHGTLYVGFDWFPETPLTFVQPQDRHFQYEEIPTVPTELEQAQDAIVRVIKKLDELISKQ